MLVRFLYLDTSTLADYASQLDGGTLVETKRRLVRKRGGGAKAGAGGFGMNLDLSNEGEDAQTYSHPDAAHFQRLLLAAEKNPEAFAWTEVLEPESTFKDLQVGETLSWECNASFHEASRLMAKGSDGSKLLEMLPAMLKAVDAQLSTRGEVVPPEVAQKLAQLEQYGALGKKLIDDAGLKPVVVCSDEETDWTICGELNPKYLRVEDITEERLVVVGKVKRVVPSGTWRRLWTGIPLTTYTKQASSSGSGEPPQEQLDPFVRGPALLLDILALYR